MRGGIFINKVTNKIKYITRQRWDILPIFLYERKPS